MQRLSIASRMRALPPPFGATIFATPAMLTALPEPARAQKTDRPAPAEIKWPPMTLRGCARWLCGIAKTSTQLAPNGAINSFAPIPRWNSPNENRDEATGSRDDGLPPGPRCNHPPRASDAWHEAAVSVTR